MTTTLGFSNSLPRSVPADAVVIGVLKGPDGPLLAPGAADIDDALGGTLAATLGRAGRHRAGRGDHPAAVGGRLAAPLIVAVGLGPAPLRAEDLRRAAGAAARALTASAAAGRPDAGRDSPAQDRAGAARAKTRRRPRRPRSARCSAATRSAATGRRPLARPG